MIDLLQMGLAMKAERRQDLSRASTYELMVELEKRLKDGSLEFCSDRQLRAIRNGLIAELDNRHLVYTRIKRG